MGRRMLVSMKPKTGEGKSPRHARLTAYCTLAYTIITGFLLLVMVYTVYQQKGFNKRQLDLYEVSVVPQVFAEFDSLIPLKSEDDYNVFYTVRNVGNTPAFKLRLQSQVNPLKVNRLEQDTSGVTADLFPTETKLVPSQEMDFRCKGDPCALYFHVRLDYQDMLEDKYCYKATYWILVTGDSPSNITMRKFGMEDSEFFPLHQR